MIHPWHSIVTLRLAFLVIVVRSIAGVAEASARVPVHLRLARPAGDSSQDGKLDEDADREGHDGDFENRLRYVHEEAGLGGLFFGEGGGIRFVSWDVCGWERVRRPEGVNGHCFGKRGKGSEYSRWEDVQYRQAGR
ncbi:hypothetical protein LY78DRAFT_196331 [Colletotrichum sublineola]|nr:hypothetical protein LY78DRAFT_196331 [Colletotrichum sublineola]